MSIQEQFSYLLDTIDDDADKLMRELIKIYVNKSPNAKIYNFVKWIHDEYDVQIPCDCTSQTFSPDVIDMLMRYYIFPCDVCSKLVHYEDMITTINKCICKRCG